MSFGSYYGYYFAPPEPYMGTNIYIRGLSPSINDDDLYRLVAEYGEVLSSKAIVDLKTGVCKGYGFSMYQNSIQARMAMDGLSRKGFIVTFAVATPRDNSVISYFLDKFDLRGELQHLADNASTNVYISNLPLDMVNDNDLRQLASNPLDIDSCKVLVDSRGISRGVGFVRFKTRDAAEEMIDKFHGKFLPGSNEALQVRFADSQAQKAYKGMFKLYKKSMSRYAMPWQYYYPSQFYYPHYQQSTCASSDTTLADECGTDEMLEAIQG